MARRESAARRYAEAAFEVATRDDALEAWRAGRVEAQTVTL